MDPLEHSTALRRRRCPRSTNSAGVKLSIYRLGKIKHACRLLPTVLNITLIGLAFLALRAEAAFITFENCLDPSIILSNPRQLQFVPIWFDAKFNTTSPSHNMNITIYGNVTGQATEGEYPPPNDPSWSDPNNTFGKIVDVSLDNNKRSTLFSKFQVLTYTAYNAPASPFCNSTINASCPLGPAFNGNRSDPYTLPAFSVAHSFFNSYAFATFAATIRIKSGDRDAPDLACVSANIAPDLGATLSDLLTYLPAAILMLVALATASAAIFSPWGSSDPFRWTSNYGRDEDLLRLVTPGFGDCLQYIQFVVLAGSLSLNYPGYYQPVVSQVGWAVLMFNQSFVSHGAGRPALLDGVYVVNGTYGLDRLSQLVGLAAVRDVWAGMVIWLLVVIAFVLALCQLAFLIRWAYRYLKNSQPEDLRRKNFPFTAGNVVRIVYNYFLLPIVALTMYQLLVAPRSPNSVVGLAVVLLVGIICFAGWILRLIFTTRPRSHLFDDLPTVLLYGPLYNTYSDDAAPFALVPVLLTLIRGIAIGAIQPSGIAQLVLLAICEVILILTLHAFRPFHSPTSMNAYHTFFAVIRLAAILLSVAFVPSLGVTEAPKGWIGYVILLMHAIVLVFGFFLNAVQTLIEVCARLAGAGGDEGTGGGATRGGLVKVFGMRQLSRRAKRRPHLRHSMTSDAAILTQDADAKSIQLMSPVRSRSMSASSAVLLNQHLPPDLRQSGFFDHSGQGTEYNSLTATNTGPESTGAAQSIYSFLPSAAGSATVSRRPTLALKTTEPADPYYRAPRPRRMTGELDTVTPGARSRGSWASGEWTQKQYADLSPEQVGSNGGEGSSSLSPNHRASVHGTPIPAYFRGHRDDSDSNLNDSRRSYTDYAVRESDFYYGVRGPALSSLPTRRLKTGPADPMNPVSSATGWIRNMFGGKMKDKGKGFEVVRSSRAPPEIVPANAGGALQTPQPRYHDSPESQKSRYSGGRAARRWDAAGAAESDSSTSTPKRAQVSGRGDTPSSATSDMDAISDVDEDETSNHHAYRVTDVPPSLAPIETGGRIELPHRIGFRVSKAYNDRNFSRNNVEARQSPMVHRRTSRRTPSAEYAREHPAGGRAAGDSVRPGIGESSRVPFGSEPPSVKTSRPSAGAYSNVSSTYTVEQVATQESSNGRHLAAQQSAERPTSVGYVNERLTSDSIHPGLYGTGVHEGSEAELVEGPRSKRVYV